MRSYYVSYFVVPILSRLSANYSPGFVFGGALLGFILARLQYLDINGRFCPRIPANDGSTGLPPACYWVVHFPRYRAGMILHLATSLPAGLLAVFQFVPGIRHKAILYHRIAGYVAITLAVVGNIGAVMIADTAMGGELSTQTFVGFIAIVTTLTFSMAIYNIKKQQLDGHRAWMLRTWAYLGFIVTLRIIQAVMATITTAWASAARSVVVSCPELRYIYLADEEPGDGIIPQSDFDAFGAQYPACVRTGSEEVFVAVAGRLGEDRGQNSAALMASFAAAGFLALVLHAIVVEVYLYLTPRETERLRQISFQRQQKLGYKYPGSAGITAQRFGDADYWEPPAVPL